MITEEIKEGVEKLLSFIGIDNNIDYDVELEGRVLSNHTNLKLSEGEDFVQYKTKSDIHYGKDGISHPCIQLIIPKEKLQPLYHGGIKEQYYIISVRHNIRKLYYLNLHGYTTDFKTWYTNEGMKTIK